MLINLGCSRQIKALACCIFLLQLRKRNSKGKTVTIIEKTDIKQQIEKALAKIEKEVKDLTKNAQPIIPDCSLDDIGRTEAMTEVSVQAKILAQAELKQSRLKYALRHVDDELFGICIECEEPINIERIMVRPESVRCVKCAD